MHVSSSCHAGQMDELLRDISTDWYRLQTFPAKEVTAIERGLLPAHFTCRREWIRQWQERLSKNEKVRAYAPVRCLRGNFPQIGGSKRGKRYASQEAHHMPILHVDGSGHHTKLSATRYELVATPIAQSLHNTPSINHGRRREDGRHPRDPSGVPAQRPGRLQRVQGACSVPCIFPTRLSIPLGLVRHHDNAGDRC